MIVGLTYLIEICYDDVITVLHKWITLILYIYSKDKHEIFCEIDKHGVFLVDQ